MKKLKTAVLLVHIYLLNLLYGIVSHIPFAKNSKNVLSPRKIKERGKKIHMKLGPAYHIGIRSTRVPSRFRVQLYQEPGKETLEKTHREIAQRREQRITNQAVNSCDQ